MSRNTFEAECDLCRRRYVVLIGNPDICPNIKNHPDRQSSTESPIKLETKDLKSDERKV